MESIIQILHLEDNPTDSLLVQSWLRNADVHFDYFFADNEEDFLFMLRNQNIDLILSDYHLPGYSGSDALLFARNNYPNIPFVFLSGTMGEDAAIESLLNGATDYVLKNKMERLIPAVYRAYKEAQETKARHKAENELRKLSRAVEQSPDSIVITDTEGNIEYANPTTLKLTGYTSEETIGKTPGIFSTHEKTREEYSLLWETIQSGKEWTGEFHNKKKNGELYWESASISPIFDENGVITHYLAIKKDITESRQLTTDLIIAKEKAEESDRLKTAFLANMSHEIRTPMNGILGFAALLKEPDLSGSQQQEYIRIIEKSGARMLNIINDIISISKIESGQIDLKYTETNVKEQVKDLLEFFTPEAEHKGLHLYLENSLPDSKAIIKTDKEKLTAVLTNLIKNAIKFTKQGTITVGYNLRPANMINIEGMHVEPDVLEFYVKDTGVGIRPENREIIFERFRQGSESLTRNYEGAGLGLSISKAFVELLGGRIWFEPNPEVKVGENGSVFSFYISYLPTRQEPEIIKSIEHKIESVGMIKPLKILISEDDETSDLLIAIMLRKFNTEILHAKTGIEVLGLLKEHPDIDMILMDIQMPVMNGYEATREIRKFNNDIVIVAQTAYALSGEREKAMDAGCNDYFAKPIDQNMLNEVIMKYFNEKIV
jgi:PAS domain S-box-containing protein